MADPLSQQAFDAAFAEAAPRVAQTAPPGLSREQFNELVIDEIERTQGGSRPSLRQRVIPAAMRIVPTVAGGFLGSALGPAGTAAGGAIGAALGEYAGERYEQLTGQRDEINPTQVGVQTVLGAIPLGRVVGSTVGQIAARRAAQGAGMGAVSGGLTESAETGELPSVGSVAGGAVLGGLLGGGAGRLEGTALRRLGRLDEPLPSQQPTPVALLPAGARFQATADGRVVPAGADIPMAQGPDGSFARGVPAAYARREVAGLLPAGREPIITPPPPGSVRGDSSFVRGVPAEYARHEIAGLLPEGRPAIITPPPPGSTPRTPPSPEDARVSSTPAAVIDREIDPTVPAREAVRVRQYSGDVEAVDAPFVTDRERQVLEVMRQDLETFTPERGGLQSKSELRAGDPFINRPNIGGGAHYVAPTPGSPVADDIRVISEQNVSNRDVANAIDDLLAGKRPTNRLHTAAIDAARGYLEGREGYRGPVLPLDAAESMPWAMGRGGGAPAPAVIDDFDAFARIFDDIEPSPHGEPGELGFIRNQLLLRGGGALAGGAAGAASGETTQERIENAALGATAGALAPSLLSGLRRRSLPTNQPRRLVALDQLRPVGSGVTREAVASNLTPRASQTVQGRARRDPLAGTEGFIDRLSGGNPLLRAGVRERLQANAGYDVQRRGVLDVETTGDLAEHVRVDVSRGLPRGTAPNAETVVAYTRAANRTLDRVRQLSERVASRQATDDDVVKLAAAQADAEVVMRSMMGLRSEAGRALAAFRTFTAVMETGDVNLIRQAAAPLREDAARIAGQVRQLGTPLEQYRFLQSQNRPSIADKARSYYYSSILSGLKTHERNILGNTASLLSRFVSTPAAAAVDAVAAARTGQPRQVYLGELQPAAVGAVAGMQKGLRAMVFTFKHGVSPDALDRSVTAAVEHGSLDLPRVEFGGGGSNPLNWPGRALDAADAFFRTTGRDVELYASAWSKAKSEGLSGDRLLARAAALRTDAALQTSAQRFAVETVFQNKPGPIGGLVQALARAVPGGYFVVPFIKTPANILKMGVQASPVGFLTKAGQQGGRAGVQAQGLAATGSLLLAPIAWLAATNRLSGSGPREPAERAALMESGWRPNSVRIGDQWVEYSLFQPISVPAMAVANAYETWRREGASEESAVAKAGEAVIRAGRSLLDQSYLSGLYDFLQAVDDPERFFSQWGGRLAHSLTPFAGAQRTVTQALDPVVRQPKTASDVFTANVPGASTSVQPRLSRFGELVTRPGGATAPIDPFNRSPVVSDPVGSELSRLGVRVALPTDRIALPSGAALSTDESVAFRSQKGQQLKTRLARLIAHPNYQRLPDALKRNAIKRVQDASNRDANSQERRREALQLRGQRREALMQQLAQ